MRRKISSVLFALMVAWCLAPRLHAQSPKDGLSLQDLYRLKPGMTQETPQIGGKLVPMDSPVEPEEYFVGPNDILTINIWTSSPVEHRLTVTPEGALLIPSIGALTVRDMTLKSVQEKVGAEIQKKYPAATVSVSLTAPRQVVVQIAGHVLNENKFDVYSIQRVDQLVAMANNSAAAQFSTPEEFQQQLAYVNRSSSKRHILLKHRDGSSQNVDIAKYWITHKGTYNPYLREGDVVYVPWSVPRIGISGGGVTKSRTFEYVEGDSILDLVSMGYGLTVTADSAHATLARFSADGVSMDSVAIDLHAIITAVSPNIALRSGDRVVVPEKEDSKGSFTVTVEGEIRNPGDYPITRQNTKLSEVIAAAGGFTPDAYIRGATLMRERISPLSLPEQIEREQLLSIRASLSGQDSGYYMTETALRTKGEVVSVDFQKLFVEGDVSQDVALREFDRIIVPLRQRTVYVFGQVLSPGHIALSDGDGYRHYIERAGGFTKDARNGDVKIIKSNTRAWLDPSETEVEDGDFIWVPKDVHYPSSYYITTWAQIASIVGVVATVALLVNTIK